MITRMNHVATPAFLTLLLTLLAAIGLAAEQDKRAPQSNVANAVSPKQITAAIKQRLRDFRHCYNVELKKDRQLAGKIVIR